MAGELRLENGAQHISLAGHHLPLRTVEREMIVYLALRETLGHHDWVDIAEFQAIGTWQHLRPKGVYMRVERAVARLAKLGFGLLEQPGTDERMKTRKIRLNKSLISTIVFADGQREEIRQSLLALSEPVEPPVKLHQFVMEQHLLLAARAFETGQYTLSAYYCQQILASPSHLPEHEIQALARLLRIAIFTESDEAVQLAVARLRQAYTVYGGNNSIVFDCTIMAHYHNHLGRYYLRFQRFAEAGAAYKKALYFINKSSMDKVMPNRELASYHAGLESIADYAGHLPVARKHATLALEVAVRCGWPWLVHVQSSYLGGLSLREFVEKARIGEWRAATRLVQEAISFLKNAHEIMELENYMSGPAEVQLMLVHAGRCHWWIQYLTQPQQRPSANQRELQAILKSDILYWLEMAEKIARDSGYLLDLPRIIIEKAEYAYLTGQTEKAIDMLKEACELSEKVHSRRMYEIIVNDTDIRIETMRQYPKPSRTAPRWL